MRQLIRRSLPILRGGPDFANSILYKVDCGAATIEFLVPHSPIGGFSYRRPPAQLDLGAPPPELMEKASEERTGHSRIALNAANWMYGGPWWRCGQEPYVIVTQTWTIERVKNGLTLDPANLEALKAYLAQDYEAYFESEGGPNAEVRRKAYECFEQRDGPIERYKEDIESWVKVGSRTLPSDYTQRRIADTEWVRYTWEPKFKGQPNDIHYSTLVDPKNILTVGFCLTRMTPGTDTYWLKTALKDIEQVMTGTTVKHHRLSATP